MRTQPFSKADDHALTWWIDPEIALLERLIAKRRAEMRSHLAFQVAPDDGHPLYPFTRRLQESLFADRWASARRHCRALRRHRADLRAQRAEREAIWARYRTSATLCSFCHKMTTHACGTEDEAGFCLMRDKVAA